jgi:hypothetical protein
VNPADYRAEPFTLSGFIRESESGGPVADAFVFTHSSSTLTGPDGSYVLVIADTQIPIVTKEGFEWRSLDRVDASSGHDQTLTTTLQSIIRIEAGETVIASVFPDEGSGLFGEDDCEPCKRIRITIPHNGMLRLHLTPNDLSADLRMVIQTPSLRGQQPGSTPVIVKAGEEAQVFVYRRPDAQGKLISSQRFELATSLEPN